MASTSYTKKTWKGRLGTDLDKYTIGPVDLNGRQKITPYTGGVTQQGDPLNASNLNDLEGRIDSAFESVEGDISDIKDGTTVVEKAKKDQNGNVIDTTYATKTELSTEVSKITGGTTIAKKAEQDEDGNKIKTTYQKVANKKTSWGDTPSNDNYPSEKLVKDTFDAIEEGDIVVGKSECDKYGNPIDETYAKQNGYYAELGAGTAEQLVSTQTVEDNALYLFRTSGGSVDIGNREDDEIVGGTLGVNQQLVFENDTNYQLSNATVAFLNNQLVATPSTYGSNSAVIKQGIKYEKDHKYLFSIRYKLSSGSGTTAINIWTYNGNVIDSDTITDTAEHKFEKIFFGYGYNGNFNFGFTVASGTGNILRTQLIDLTAMFGAEIADYIYALEQANAGAGVAWFRRYFPKPNYEWQIGLSSVKPQSHDMTGFNAWDEQWEVGGVDSETGQPWSQQRIRPKNFIPILPLTEYFFYCGSLSSDYVAPVRFYDANHNYLGAVNADGVSTYNNTVFKTPANAYFMKFVSNEAYGLVYKNDICINLSWSGTRNGEYEAFEKHSYALDDSTEYRGLPKLDADGNLYFDGDVYKSSGDVTRNYGIANLGDLAWSQQSGYATTMGISSIVKPPVNGNTIADLISDKYIAETRNGFSYGLCLDSNGRLLVAGDAPTQGVVVFKLINPTIEQAAPFTNPQIVNDWGTEEYVDTRDMPIPVGHNTKYMANLRDKLQHLPNLANGDGEYVVKQIGTQMELVKTDNLKKDGYYPTLAVGTADNLKGKGTVGADFTFRTAGGSADIGSGSARLDKILGNTLMMGQKVANGDFSAQNPMDGWTTNAVSSVSNKVCTLTMPSGSLANLQRAINTQSGHIVLMSMRINAVSNASIQIRARYPFVSAFVTISTGMLYFRNSVSEASNFGIQFQNFSDNDTVQISNINTFDLTQMFGAGNEPTVDEFKALFPLDYYDYNEGTPLNFKGTGLKTVGFNQMLPNLAKTTSYYIASETGEPYGWGSGWAYFNDYIRVLGGLEYELNGMQILGAGGTGHTAGLAFYDSNKNYISGIDYGTSRYLNQNHIRFTTPQNAMYVRFTCYSDTESADLCLHLVWSGIRNGETEPYWDSTLPLPITTIKGKASGSDESVVIFPDGMNGVGTVRDELTARKGQVRIGKHTFDGTEIWVGWATGSSFWQITDPSIYFMKASSNSVAVDFIASDAGLPINPANSIGTNGGMGVSTGGAFLVADTDRSRLTGKTVYYALLTSVEYDLDEELNLNYRVDDFGTEQLLPENTSVPVTSPLIAQIAYAMNAVDTLRNLDKNFTNLATLDGLIAIINSKCGVTITRGSFDSANNKYTFS